MTQEFVSLKHLAAELGMDRSHMRRYVLRHGLHPHKRRTVDSANQLTLAITAEEAEFVRLRRREEGFGQTSKPVATDRGFFYVVRLVPDLDPSRIKLGFAEDIQSRLDQHRTAAPTATIVKSWPCRRSWEVTVMDCLTAKGCRLIKNEVFECADVAELVERGDRLFPLLPVPSQRPPLADGSPHGKR